MNNLQSICISPSVRSNLVHLRIHLLCLRVFFQFLSLPHIYYSEHNTDTLVLRTSSAHSRRPISSLSSRSVFYLARCQVRRNKKQLRKRSSPSNSAIYGRLLVSPSNGFCHIILSKVSFLYRRRRRWAEVVFLFLSGCLILFAQRKPAKCLWVLYISLYTEGEQNQSACNPTTLNYRK